MQEPTKKPRTESSHLLMVSCPAVEVQSVMELLKRHGCDVNDATPDEEEEYITHVPPPADQAPGIYLRGLRCREDLTQEEFASRVGIPRRHISEMENNKRPIGKHNARRIADVFNIDPRMFLSA